VDYLIAALLGIVQGVTEFLPISSSAHLILARAIFGWDGDQFGLAFDIAVHVGTLGAVLCYFRADLRPLAAAVPGAVAGAGGAYPRLVRLIVVGTIPTVVLGLLAADVIEAHLRTPVVCVVTLAVGALGMMGAERLRPRGRGADDITALEAFAIGCGQAAAMIPGFSRSGTTITVAMLFGIRREAAARFTFLMSIPAILGAAGRQTLALPDAGTGIGAGVFAVGAASAGLVGYVAVRFFIRYLADHPLDVFAYYRFAVAASVVIWLAF
jgi:undecaprenyl-diphosphatase